MSSEQELKCVFCSETFSQKEDLQIHFRKHGDPNFSQKKGTGRSQDETDGSETKKDQAELVECDVCSEVFTSISKAITHKHKAHPDHDTKYFCPWCGKLFTMKHLYNKHLQTNHLGKDNSNEGYFHCDSCEVIFYIPAAMAYHNKFYHRQDDLPTLGHSKKLKMILEEVVQIYYCPFCGEEYDNKVNLHKHMSEDHSSENQSPEDVLRCPLCDAIFYYLDAYEIHLTYHSIEDLYTERSELLDEITDFSLEIVQPLQEKVESVNPSSDEVRQSLGIEDLLELTMGDPGETRKSKKHKKHKKSKKAAITLDEFLSMNKDVFGDGIDFQGIEEVPTQFVTKRLKTNKTIPPHKMVSSDLAKLKRQGIVVKKQSGAVGRPVIKKKVPNTVINQQKNLNLATKTKPTTLTSTDDVLSKLLNQGSQIKIVKKSNHDTEDNLQKDEFAAPEPAQMESNKEGCSTDMTEEKEEKTLGLEIINDVKSTIQIPNANLSTQETMSVSDYKHDEHSNDSVNNNGKTDSPDQLLKENNPLCNSDSLLNSDIAMKSPLRNISHDKNENPRVQDSIDVASATKVFAQRDAETNNELTEKPSLNALKHLSHLITIKSVGSPQNSTTSNCEKPENSIQKQDTAIPLPLSNSPKQHEANNLSILKNLGITVKSSKQPNILAKNKLETEMANNDEEHEAEDELNKDGTVTNIQTNKIENKPEANNLSIFKNLGITVKSKQTNILSKSNPITAMEHCDEDEEHKADDEWNKDENVAIYEKTPSKASNLSMLKNLGITVKSSKQPNVVAKSNQAEEINHSNEKHETDDERNEDENDDRKENKTKHKIAHLLKGPQTQVQKKNSPKTVQNESPKIPYNDNSQSSADLLKHLKNVTAKPVNQRISSPKCSPTAVKRNISKPSVLQEVTEDGIEIFNIDDSDSDEANHKSVTNLTKIESKETQKPKNVFQNINRHVTKQSSNEQHKVISKDNPIQHTKHFNEEEEENDDWSDNFDETESRDLPKLKYNKTQPSSKLNQKNVAINSVLKNLGKNITVKSRNSSPSQIVKSEDHNSRDSHAESNEGDSDSDAPLSRVKITEMNSDEELVEQETETNGHVKVQHPEDSHSEHEDAVMDEDFDDMSDVEAHIKAAKVQKYNNPPNSSLNNLKKLNKDLTIKSSTHKAPASSRADSMTSDEIPQFAKKVSDQISIKQMKKPESNKTTKATEQTAHSNRSTVNQKTASSSNQLNTFNKEVKTVKTLKTQMQTQTQTVIQEITTTVTKTIKTVNQSMRQEIKNVAQSSASLAIPQKVQGMKTTFTPTTFQGMKVRQAPPNIRPKIRGQAPQGPRPAICAPLPASRSAICAPSPAPRAICAPPPGARAAICAPPLMPRAPMSAPVSPANQLVTARAAPRVAGPRPRPPRPSTSGQQRPQLGRPVKVSPAAVYPPRKPAEPVGHFSCFKKPKESLFPVSDITPLKSDGESSMQFSSVQMSKSNFSSTTKSVKGGSVVTSTQVKSEASASSQQLSRLRNVSGLSVVKTSQSQAKQTRVEEKSEMSASKRNALEAIQKLQNQGLLVKKPRLDMSGESDHSQPSDDMEHDSNEEFDESFD